MKVLVVGGGGREHALAWRLAHSDSVHCVYVAPGNAGTARSKLLRNAPFTSVKDLADFVQREKVDLTVVGPEAPLSKGIVNLFRMTFVGQLQLILQVVEAVVDRSSR